MARTNVLTVPKTHEGAPASRIDKEAHLRRSVSSCLLWEKEFYEDGEDIATRILGLANDVEANVVAGIATRARAELHLRHVPLLLAVALMRKGGPLAGQTLATVIQRADELAEFVSLYWKINGEDAALSAQAKKGLAAAFGKFDEYQFAKYDRKGSVQLRDVLRLVHPVPINDERSSLYKRIASQSLATPDTWEVALSAGQDKRETWLRLLEEGRLGYMALLRNLRGMQEAGVPQDVVDAAITARRGAKNVLPFRYVAALRAAPRHIKALDRAFQDAVEEMPSLPSKTGILVDVSGSMDVKLSLRSDLTRMDAAAALAALWPGEKRVWTFSQHLVEVPAFSGMALLDAILRSQEHGMTNLGAAVREVGNCGGIDRMVVITDEQSRDKVSPPSDVPNLYMVNVASAENGVGYRRWNHIDGFSENIIRWIAEVEGCNG